MTRIAGNLYAITSLSPVVGDTKGVSLLYSCLPLDFRTDGNVSDDTRYVSIVSLPPDYKGIDIMPLFDYARPITYQWITYLWEVA